MELGAPSQNMLYFLDPISLQEQPGIDLGKDRSLLDTLISPEGKTIALAFYHSQYYSLSIKDLNTGGETYLSKTLPPPIKTDGYARYDFKVMKFLAWLPE